jgi:hypothetical protein
VEIDGMTGCDATKEAKELFDGRIESERMGSVEQGIR